MERPSGEKLIPTLILSGAVLLGAVACVGEERPPRHPVTTTTEAQPQNYEMQPLTPEQVAEQIREIEFLGTPQELAALNRFDRYREQNSANFLTNKNIGFEDKRSFFTSTKLSDLAEALAVLPCAAVRASGLRAIALIDYKDEDEALYYLPKAENGVAEIPDIWNLNTALALMTIERSPELPRLIQAFSKLSADAGQPYDPNYPVVYNTKEQPDAYSNSEYNKKYQDVFTSQEAIRDPKVEMAQLYSDLLAGGSFTQNLERGPLSVRGQKEKLMQDFYISIVPNGRALLQLYSSNYGSQGQHPYEYAERYDRLSKLLNAAPNHEAQDKIWQEEKERTEDAAGEVWPYRDVVDATIDRQTPPGIGCHVIESQEASPDSRL